MKIPAGFELIGTVDVDSGTLMIVDPCYVDEGFDYDAWNPFELPNDGVITSPVTGGLAFSTFQGDGGWPVYGYFEQDTFGGRAQRRLSAVLIDTNPEYDDQDALDWDAARDDEDY